MLSQDVNEIYKYFIATINEIGTYLLKCSDEEIEQYVFEEFDTDSISFLFWRNLRILLDHNFIDENIYKLSLKLRRDFRKLDGTQKWNTYSVRYDSNWLNILTLADCIKELIEKNCISRE